MIDRVKWYALQSLTHGSIAKLVRDAGVKVE
jgi:hypothetical protein